jgi:uncharacterized membrane protein
MRLRRSVVIPIGVLALAAGAWLFATPAAQCTTARAVDGIVSVSLSNLKPGTTRLFCYDDAGKRLRFLLSRGNDGTVQAAFDACRQCYTFHRGYRIEHGEIICRVCGNRYQVAHMTEGKASCVPARLSTRVSGNTVTVQVSNLRAGRSMF